MKNHELNNENVFYLTLMPRNVWIELVLKMLKTAVFISIEN